MPELVTVTRGGEAVRRAALEGLAVPLHCETLGVSPRANAMEIRIAYRVTARRLHPAAVGGSTAGIPRLDSAWHVRRHPRCRAVLRGWS